MNNNFFLIIDLVSLGMGIFLLVAPNKVYNWGRKEGQRQEPPKNWNVIGRVLGAVFVLIGIFFVYLDLRA